MNEEADTIEAGARVDLFLSDPAILGAFEKLDKQYYKEFKEALAMDDVALIKAKSTVLADLQTALRAVVSNGQHTAATRERREKNNSTRRNGR